MSTCLWTFDILGWLAPAIIKVKILLQRLWEQRVDWDKAVPDPIYKEWLEWRSNPYVLSTKHIPRCYFDTSTQVASLELHGFSDASENAYAAVVYLRITDTFGQSWLYQDSSHWPQRFVASPPETTDEEREHGV